MTGVIKSSRCGTCRRRKVKCDEVKPVCGPCRKKNRICEEPVSRYKFTEEGVALSEYTPPATKDARPTLNVQDIATIRSTPATDGSGSFQTLRLVRGQQRRRRDQDDGREVTFPRGPSISEIETLRGILLQSFAMYQGGYRLSALTSFVAEIPARLGHSQALDSAVACLINCHASLCRGKVAGRDPKQASLYAKCLISLQRALGDPVEGYSDETLAAVTIIGQVEIYGGGFQGDTTKWISHAGGAARLLQVRGPEHCQTMFSKMLLSMQRFHSMVVSIARGEDCYLAESAWRQISFEELYKNDVHPIIIKFNNALLSLPSICKRTRLFHHTQDAAEAVSIFLEICQLRHSLAAVDQFVHEKLHNGRDITIVPAQQIDSLTPFVYQFASNDLADICVSYWAFSIIINTMMARFLPYQPPWTNKMGPPRAANAAIASSVSTEELCDDCIRTRQHIFMSYEYSEQRWPLDVMYMASPLIFAFHGATQVEQDWLLSKLWRVGALMPNARKFWSKEGVEFIAKLYLGEPIPRMPFSK